MQTSTAVELKPWWRHQMETFSAGNSPHKGQWRGALKFYLICAWINGWVNNDEAGDLRRHRAHSGVVVMMPLKLWHWVYLHPIILRSVISYTCPNRYAGSTYLCKCNRPHFCREILIGSSNVMGLSCCDLLLFYCNAMIRNCNTTKRNSHWI